MECGPELAGAQPQVRGPGEIWRHSRCSFGEVFQERAGISRDLVTSEEFSEVSWRQVHDGNGSVSSGNFTVMTTGLGVWLGLSQQPCWVFSAGADFD